jgi:hypothetical protein
METNEIIRNIKISVIDLLVFWELYILVLVIGSWVLVTFELISESVRLLVLTYFLVDFVIVERRLLLR